MRSVISVSHLSKRYGDLEAVADVSFDVYEGEIFGLLGPNGAGKTTTVECVQGLRTADSGEIRVLGLDPNTQGDRLRPLIGSQLQESSLPQRIKVWEALDLFSSLVAGGEPWDQVMEQWGLTEKADASFGSLSGGQRQRLLVALALISRPKVVFLDEMTTGLDPAARRAAWRLIGQIREAGTTVVLVTHLMDEAERLCDRLAVVDEGRIVSVGTPAELISRYDDRITVRFSFEGSDERWLESLPGVERVRRRGHLVELVGSTNMVPWVGKSLVDHGYVPADMTVIRPTLEDVYLRMVGEEVD
jgi:ABC-2 type transport system ATP-binding protein